MSRVFLRNLPGKITESEIENLFSKCGTIDEIVLKSNFAFIQFSTPGASEDAIAKYNDYFLYGNHISVELAKSRNEKLAERIYEKCFKCGEMGHWAKDCKGIAKKNNTNTNFHTNNNSHQRTDKKRRFRHVRKSPRRSFSRTSSSSSGHSRNRSRSRSKN